MEYHLKRKNERTVAGRISGLVSCDGGDRTRGIFDNEHRVVNVGGESRP